MGSLPSMKHLLWYLQRSSVKPGYFYSGDVDICRGLPWKKDTIMFVLSYIFHFISSLEHCEFSDAIMPLHEIANCVHDLIEGVDKEHEIDTKQAEWSEMLVNSFFPDVVRRFFTVPKLYQLPQSDKHLYPNEILAGFMDFLLQVLYHETNTSEDQVQRWAVVRKELSFLLAVLGDIPFQCTHHHEIVGEINILLAEFEMLANQAGSFVYDGVFSIHQIEADKFHAITTAWFEKVELLNDKIKEHCFKFSELPMSVISRSGVVDSFFIIHSLLEDIENLKHHTLNLNHGDGILELMKALYGELTLSLTFIKVMQDNEEKKGLIEIRDLTYEAEYLINSLFVGNIHVWYVNMRLPSIIHKIRLACIGLQQISYSKLMIASDGKVSYPATGNTTTMEENLFLDFSVDITQTILNDPSSDYMKIFEHGYKHLSHNIKPCFLYFAAFPKDSEIPREKLTWLWIAEGFIQKEGNKSLEETAEMYLLDLINRKLVLIAKSGFNGAIKKCRIQSLLHEFCVRKANGENFIKLTDGFSMYEKCQHLCLPSTSSRNLWRPLDRHCRSYRDFRRRQSTCFQTMSLLKVVDQCPQYNEKVFRLPAYYNCRPYSALAFPSQLRYLGVNHFSNKVVANLVNLEFIIVRTYYTRVNVPSVVLRMVKLRHLLVERDEMYEYKAVFEEDCSSNMSETTNLRTLSGVWIDGKKGEDILRRCPHLHKLKCIFADSTGFPDLSFFAELESLKLCFQKYLTPGILSSKINFPSTMKKLSLSRSKLPWEMMSILGSLPNLEVLKLDWDAFHGDVWETRNGEFQKLKCLKIFGSDNPYSENFHSLRLWISCREHFPVLECLFLGKCDKLLDIPSDFLNIQSLQRLEVKNCNKAAYLSALQFGRQIQVDITEHKQTKDDLIPELKNPTLEDLMNLLSCLEEYFKAGGSQRFINKLPTIIDQTEDGATTDDKTKDEVEDAFVLRDVLSYMEQHFKAEGSEESVKTLTIIDQTEDETTTTTTTKNDDDGDDEPLLFMNHQTYFIVVTYAMQFSSDLENLTIMGLRCVAESYNSRKQFLPGFPCYVDEIKKSKREFSDMLENAFLPQVQRFFQAHQIEQSPDKHLKKNEILASFMDFLLQMLSCEVNTDSAEAEKYALLQKDFYFLLAVLGDIPFQPTDHSEFGDQLNNLLAEFEMFANEAGSFLFSCVFAIQPMKISRFRAEMDALLEMAKLLNAKIKQHCTNFSGLPVSVIMRPNVVDSFFIIDSLVGDLQSLIMNGQIGNFIPVDSIKEQMKILHGELTLSRSFFSVLQYMEGNEEKGLIQIRDLTYEAEYLIYSVVEGNIDVWYLNLRLPSIIEKIKLARVGLQQISNAKVIKTFDGKVSVPFTGNTATIDDNQFLDFNQDFTQRILNDLTGKSNTSRQVITIFGMPGLGKTTTANKVYNSRSGYFDRRAWCVVSQNYSVRNLLIEILMCVTSDPDESKILKKDAAELGVDIHKTLKGRRYLIVLDDVWNSEVLDNLQIYFPNDRNGSRVMITTRNKYVSPSGSIIYELPFLSEDQCWHLLEKKVFPEDPCPSNLVNIGKRIAVRCSGVPLAVVSIAGILLNVGKEESEWERVEEQLDTILLDDQSDYKKIMELSYDHLPHHLKPCFLYFAIFPEDAEVSTKELAWFWTAEGFIQKEGSKRPEEIAETYLLDLINRSLVMIAKRKSVGGMKTCRIHDLLHDICIKKADEENFLKSTNLFSSYNDHQHLCRPSSSHINWRPFGLHCRSFRGYSNESSGFRTVALLKVVDVIRLNGHYLFKHLKVDLPCQLRYLGISSDEIPEKLVDNLVSLEVLHIRSGYGVEVIVPSVILRMAKLRHLLVRDKAKFEEDCSDDISETTNLRSISCVVISKKSDEEILRKSPHLRTLKCFCTGETMFPDLSSLAELESLRIDHDFRPTGEILLSEASFPSTIKKLCLSWSGLPWEKMSIIGELPNLEVLKLEYFAFVGEEWETKDDQFQELRVLKLHGSNLKHWSSESSHFPSLEQLVLSLCDQLVEIPSDLGYIPTLQRIELISSCSKEACLSAIEIEKEQHETGNPELQVDIIKNKWTKDQLRDDPEAVAEDSEDSDTE